jgi:hypothetical protein
MHRPVGDALTFVLTAETETQSLQDEEGEEEGK